MGPGFYAGKHRSTSSFGYYVAMKTFTDSFATLVQHRTWITVPLSDVHIVLITLYALTYWLGL